MKPFIDATDIARRAAGAVGRLLIYDKGQVLVRARRTRSVEDTDRKDEESDPGRSRVPIKPVKAAGATLDNVEQVASPSSRRGYAFWKRNAFNRLNTIQSLGIMAVCMFPTGRLLNIASLDDNRADEGVVEPSPFCLLKSTTTVMANRGLQAIDRQPTPSVSTN
ncbi:hypothetical protein T4D_12834 [Trichinella pseudospiralis]|uniref:Uncharacterized protein n=1 Tax=Trichinella pseudospiralis TaxID=6337 RepID=A0A0V1FMV4_TRIPS|nr:hypothetical protein T4D_12834 [Trichinella pseudospiralis]